MFKTGLTTIIGALIFQTGALAQIHVKNPGDVGIGTSTPSSKLHVYGITTAGHPGGGYHLIVNDVPTARWALGTGNHAFHIANDYPVTTTWADKFVINHEGKVGIGVSQPTAMLTLPNAGNASLRVGVNSNMANTHTQLINSMAVLGDGTTSMSSCGAVANDYYNNGNSPSWAGTLLLHNGKDMTGNKYGVSASNQGTLLFQNLNAGVIATNGAPLYISPLNTVAATFTTNGYVGIGTTNPEQRLHVIGNVKAEYFIAYNNNTWPDYVFGSTYQLPSLPEIKKYIDQHHHLPDVPSEEEVKKDGINLSDNQVILLKKIEELTLYAIDQNEKLQLMEQKLNALLENDKKQKEEIENLKKKKVRQ